MKRLLCFLTDHDWRVRCAVEDHSVHSTECFLAFQSGPAHEIVGVCERCGKVIR